MECLCKGKKLRPCIGFSDATHLAEVADVENVASNVPAEALRSAFRDTFGNLREIASWVGPGHVSILRPSFAGLRI